jgi:multiple sugar transport system permease protein
MRHVVKNNAFNRLRQGEALTAYVFISPTVIGFLAFIIGPVVAAFILSFYEWNLMTPPRYVGLANYEKLMNDVRLQTVYWVTFRIAAMVVISNLVLGLAIAVMLDRKMPRLLQHFFRLSYFFPYVVSAAVISIIWSFLLHRDLGPINYYLGLLGVGRINWLNSSQWAPVSIVITEVWKNVGFYILVFLGGLQAIPASYYDAADVDGANEWEKFFHVTLPLLSPTTLFLVVISTIGALQIFAQPFILTRGGPGDATRTIVMYIYEQGFRFFSMGYASTVALSLFAVILLLTLLQFWISKRWVFYQ